MFRGYEFPDHLCYLVEHDVWARPEADGCVRVGITALGAGMAGELYAYIPKAINAGVERERSFGVVEMSKAIRSVRSPVSGRIAEVNVAAVTRPALINDDPYGEGWLARLVPEDWNSDRERLLSAEQLEAPLLAYMDLYNIR